jgi:two-component system CheB/CheR fusion protein
MLVFSEQDVIKDPPFSKLDLISCRNLLIYLGADLQRKLISLFHYALCPGGMLFLGTSETVGEFSDWFAPLDRKAKLYRRREEMRDKPHQVSGGLLLTTPTKVAAQAMALEKPQCDMRHTLRELTEQTLLQHEAPVAVLVNAQGEILFFRGRTGRYLEPTPGEAGTSNILRMARDGLRRDLTQCLHKAVLSKAPARAEGLQVETNGHYSMVNLAVYPVDPALMTPQSPTLYVVLLDDLPTLQTTHAAAIPTASPVATGDIAPEMLLQIAELKTELRNKEEYLNAANEELETTNEELKSSNEEMQSVNEELQSTNEELETSKEELQSANEELSTVNTELQTKVGDLSRANNDMNNLLAGTGIGTIFLDHSLCVLRFTPAATQIVNLIKGDVGRPIGHIVSNLVGYDQLIADAKSVLKTLIPKEVDVHTRENKSFTLRILPYRTLDNVIEGLVITFVEITEMVLTREALRRAQELMQTQVAGVKHV